MARLVKHVKQLPPSFSLNNYAALNGLDGVGWLQQFVVRVSLKASLQRGGAEAADLLAQLLRSPVVDESSDLLLRAHGEAYGLLEAASGGDAGASGAYLGSVLDHIADAHRLDREQLKTAHQLTQRIAASSSDIAEDLERLLALERNFMLPLAYNMLEPTPRVSVYLDMSMPDWLLESQLKALLSEARRLPGVPGRPGLTAQRPKPESWIKFGVLPYLDLQLWAGLTEAKIVNRVMADAIYPMGEGGEDTVRTSTATWAAALSSVDYLRFIAYWAANPGSEGN